MSAKFDLTDDGVVVVIGSGAGGGVLSNELAQKGIKVTKSGLQYLVVKEGDGPVPTAKNKVKTHYRGKLLNDTVFDQSYEGEAPADTDEPVSFGVTQVIKGWTEALQLMKAGSHYRLFIPSDLAYGPRGAGGAIGQQPRTRGKRFGKGRAGHGNLRCRRYKDFFISLSG